MVAQCLGAPPGVDRQQVLQQVNRDPIRHQRGQLCLQLVQLRRRPTVRWPTDTGVATTAASTRQPGKPYPDLAEQGRDPMRSPTLCVIPPAARLTVWAKHRVVVSLRGNDLLLHLRQQPLRFG
jgi:hypothetical protein